MDWLFPNLGKMRLLCVRSECGAGNPNRTIQVGRAVSYNNVISICVPVCGVCRWFDSSAAMLPLPEDCANYPGEMSFQAFDRYFCCSQ